MEGGVVGGVVGRVCSQYGPHLPALPPCRFVLCRWAGALCGGESGGERRRQGRRRRRLPRPRRGSAPRLDLSLELGHLLGAGQRLQQVVLLLQLRVALHQLLDLLLQHLHLLAHGVHEVALHQVHGLLDLVVYGHHTGSRRAIFEAHRRARALLAEHGGQEGDGEIPQLINAEVHRHRAALGVHARPAATRSLQPAARTGDPATGGQLRIMVAAGGGWRKVKEGGGGCWWWRRSDLRGRRAARCPDGSDTKDCGQAAELRSGAAGGGA